MLTTAQRDRQLRAIHLRLMRGKTWRFLRYIHAREALRLATDARSVLVCGAGHALAEVALAIEFPERRFHVTDYAAATHDQRTARNLAERYELTNITFGELDILEPGATPRFDMVTSVEILEHIAQDDLAAHNMRALAKRYVFCLVPFAPAAHNDDWKRRKRMLEMFEHYVCGYDPARLVGLFPHPRAIRGCYWHDAGQPFRARLGELSDGAIEDELEDLVADAQSDVRMTMPIRRNEAAGIWILSEPHG